VTTSAAGTSAPRRAHAQACTDAALTYRAGVMANPGLFQLAHSATATHLKSRPGLLEAKNRAVRALTDPLAAAASGEIDVPSSTAPISPTLRGQLQHYADAAAVPSDPHLQLFLLQAYTLVHGAVVLAVTGSLPRELLCWRTAHCSKPSWHACSQTRPPGPSATESAGKRTAAVTAANALAPASPRSPSPRPAVHRTPDHAHPHRAAAGARPPGEDTTSTGPEPATTCQGQVI
jgi:hypothetical protein